MAIRVAINGYGRIGRNVLRALYENQRRGEFEIVAVNASGDLATNAHLTKFDTVHGRFAAEVSHDEKNLIVNGDVIPFFSTRNPAELPWGELKVDVVLECTGSFTSKAKCQAHLDAGAKKVLISAPGDKDVDATVVYGVNHLDVKVSDQIISSVSCTTQALVPLVKILDDHFGIETALMTEIHAVTADQSVLDHAHRDLRRARAAGHNIIPTTSSALGALKRVMPKMADRIDGYSIRVPTINVAAIDLTFVSHSPITVHKVNEVLSKAAQYDYAQIMQVTDEDLVSSDFNHSPYSLIVDLTQTMVVGHQAKVFAWYDNEWGYANRLLDLCESFCN